MTRSLLTAACLALTMAVAPASAFAQSPAPVAAAPAAVTPADAKPYLGDWTLRGESQMGPFVMSLAMKVDAGKVVATLSSEVQAPTTVTDITKVGTGLVLRYSFDYEGNAIPVMLTLTTKEDKLDAALSFAEGAFEMAAVGIRKAPATN